MSEDQAKKWAVRRHVARLAVLGIALLMMYRSFLLAAGVIGGVAIWAAVERWWGTDNHRPGIALASLDLALAGLALVLWIGSAFTSYLHSPVAVQERNAAAVRQLAAACRQYASDHDGAYPSVLAMVTGRVELPSAGRAKLAYPDLYADWIYFPPAPGETPDSERTILLVSPAPWVWPALMPPRKPASGERIAGFLDGHMELVPELIYQANLRERRP